MKWRYLIAGTAGACLVVALVYTFLTTPLYSAVVRIQIDQQASKVVNTDSVAPPEISGNDFQRTQHELLRSRAISERTLSTLALDHKSGVEKSAGIFGWLVGLLAGPPDNKEQAAATEAARANAVRRFKETSPSYPSGDPDS